MNEKNPKKSLVEKIKKVSNILVTVSRSPSVDELTAALALALILDKLKKHTTTVFSGQIPPVMNFLEPEKTFETDGDSLRDFIISLDKSKADRLRMKTEGNFVKILITPYRTKITKDDVSFSEGDFNVELVIAIGAKNKDDLDLILRTHGRIFHDATIATISLTDDKDVLGSITWQNANANSYSELIHELAGDLGDSGTMIDEQIATALLTGVVATTDQFRNEKTTPAIMKLSAELMTDGANQQLIASELDASQKEGEEETKIENPEADVSESGDNPELILNIKPDEHQTVAELESDDSVPESVPEPNVLPDLVTEPEADAVSAPLLNPEPEPIELPPAPVLPVEAPVPVNESSDVAQVIDPEPIMEPNLNDQSTDVIPQNDVTGVAEGELQNVADNPTLKISDRKTLNIEPIDENPQKIISDIVNFPSNPEVIQSTLNTLPDAPMINSMPAAQPMIAPVAPVSPTEIPPIQTVELTTPESVIPAIEPSLSIPLPPPPPLPVPPNMGELPPSEPQYAAPAAPSPIEQPIETPLINNLDQPSALPANEAPAAPPDVTQFQIPTQQ